VARNPNPKASTHSTDGQSLFCCQCNANSLTFDGENSALSRLVAVPNIPEVIMNFIFGW
jgi:hypothetical protein